MVPIQQLHWINDLLPTTGPLTLLLDEFQRNPPRDVSEIVLNSVFADKSKLSRPTKIQRKLSDLLRPLTHQRRELHPSLEKDPDKLYLFFTGENTRIRMENTDYALGFSYDEEVKHPNYRRLPLYALDGNLEGLTKETRASLVNSLPEKTGFCEFVYSHNVKKRNALCELISQYKRVTCPGKCLNNAPSINSTQGLSPAESRQQKNWLEARIPYCRNFKFSIACENECSPGYATEKILTAFRAGTIPIYLGDPRIAEQFNPESFLDVSTLGHGQLLKKIRELDSDDESYLTMLSKAPVTAPETIAYFTQIPFIER